MSEQINPEAEDVLAQIAYLDDDAPGMAPIQILAMMKAIAQLEIAKQGHSPNAGNIALRLQSLEAQMEVMKRIMETRPRAYPIVQYVTVARGAPEPVPQIPPGYPKSLVVFYSLGLIFSIIFAIFLALSASGINAIHPFLALLGFIGSVGWLTTAWTDLLSLKAGKSWSHKAKAAISSQHVEELQMTGKL
jgi:hypothetical protein